MALIRHLRGLATQQPDAVLYDWLERTPNGDVITKHTFTYSRVCLCASALADQLLHEHHMSPGDCALLCYPPSIDYLLAFLGCILAGVVPVPAYPPDPQKLRATIPAFAKVQEITSAKIVLTNKQYSRWTSLNVLAKWPKGLKWVSTDSTFASPVLGSSTLVSRDVAPADVAFVQFSSGSTGEPKGVVISHGALWASLRGMTEGMRITPAHPPSIGRAAVTHDGSSGPPFVMMSWLPLYHDMGLVFGALLPIYRSGRALLCSPLDFIAQPIIWPLAMSKYRATVSAAPNFAFDLVVKRWRDLPVDKKPNVDLSSVLHINNGAERVRATSMTAWVDAFHESMFDPQSLCPSYGLAECTVAVSAEHSREVVHSKLYPDLVSCGSNFDRCGMLVAVLKPISTAETKLGPATVQVFNSTIADDGEIGEIFVTGNALASGYWSTMTRSGSVNDLVGGAQAFVPLESLPTGLKDLAARHVDVRSDLWCRTGDLGMIEDGHLYLTGRVKESVIIRGRNYNATDIEHTIISSASQARPGCVAVVPTIDEGNVTESVLVLCETRSKLSKEESRHALAQIQDGVKQVHGIRTSVVLLDKGSLPKTSSGKLQRSKARQMWKSGVLKSTAISEGYAAHRAAYSPTGQNDFPISGEIETESMGQPTSNVMRKPPGVRQASNRREAQEEEAQSTFEQTASACRRGQPRIVLGKDSPESPESVGLDATEVSEALAWDVDADIPRRASALYAQIRRILAANVADATQTQVEIFASLKPDTG